MSDWPEQTLGEIADFIRGVTYDPKDVKTGPCPGFIAVLRATNFSESGYVHGSERVYVPARGVGDDQVLREGDALLTASTGSVTAIGKTWVVDHEVDAAFGAFLGVVRARPGLLIPGFLGVVMSSAEIRSRWRSMARGSAIKNLSGPIIRGAPIHIPPLAVQRRIVDLVGALDSNVSSLKAESEAARSTFGALTESLLSAGRGLTLAELAARPRGLVGGPFGSLLTTKDYVDVGVPVIRGGNMPKAGSTIGGEFVFVSEEKASRLAANQAVPGDVIFTQRGTVGQVGLVPMTGHPLYIVSQSQMRLRVDPELVLPRYVFHAFSRPSVVSHLKASGQATANPHINLGFLARMTLPVPSLAEQAAIVAVLDAALDHAERLAAEATSLVVLRSVALPMLLSGRLEVPESYDEMVGAV